ncbi:hypothetical protein NQ317_003206 [Molorchus minor]|uniref:Cadherin domain-containing protein n=1 Tax=Molorchus minor TaxID=1323400 RepID=A0ABQ9J829_9CUCU|nr:hypothetical protein NQ317_003206 [Molorchus minor]
MGKLGPGPSSALPVIAVRNMFTELTDRRDSQRCPKTLGQRWLTTVRVSEIPLRVIMTYLDREDVQGAKWGINMANLLKALTFMLIISNAYSFEIEAGSDDVNVTAIEGDRYLISMNENNHDFDDGTIPNTLIFTIIGADATPTVSFVGSSFTYKIETEDSSYLFYATQSFDYETQERNYGFNLIVSGQYTYVSFTIINIDDEPPSLTSPQCNFDENTIYTNANSNCSCTVSDPDGWLDQMTFEIVPNTGGEEDIFALEYRDSPNDTVYSWPVYVTVRQELNYQNVTFYLFDIRAEDGASHSTTPNELVRAFINVNDLPDTPPQWTNYFTFQQFEEQEEQTFSVTAIDGDYGLNYEINYKKLWEDDEEANYISIDEKDGTIHVGKIDRDKNDISMYNFEINAYEVPDAPLWNTSLNISFYIIDIDNNAPLVVNITDASFSNITFDSNDTDKSTNMSFLENTSGTLNLTINVRDIDTGENAQFSIELEDIENEYNIAYTDAFYIVPTAGYRTGQFQISVRNVTYLDYEVPEWVHISFNVLTKGTLDPNKEDRLLVDITLIDYNDELPIFNDTEYVVYINETAKNGDLITQITATDRDAEDAILAYSLIGSSYTNRVLTIGSDTGEIYVNSDNAFDYDTVNPIFVQVRATDKALHNATVPLTINLLDVNNKVPTITVGDPINVDENQNATTKLNCTITASDVDTTADLTAEIDWDRSYAMKNSRRLDMDNDTIRQQVGFLDVSFYSQDEDEEYVRDIVIDLVVNSNNPNETAPDFELFDSLYLYLIVTDWNTDPEFLQNQNASALILISINDINDNTPYFPEADLPESERENRTIQENAPQTASAGSIVAIDLDVDDTVTYNCTAVDPNFDWLDINTNTGAFTVKSSNLIDADTYKTFYFNYSCTASDNGFTHTSDPLIVHFYIIDTNNKVPVISIDNDVYVDEKSPASTVVTGGEIGTEDADRDIPFHTVECSFSERNGSCFDSFVIESNVLKVRYGDTDINRDEGQATYSCNMRCQDNPDGLQNDQNPNSVDVSFTIHLNDINDHTPELVINEASTAENINADSVIGTILAKDIDEGDNAEIVFNISKVLKDDGSEVSNLFDVQVDDDYKLADKGTPPNSAFYDFTLNVQKWNFEAPRFIYPSSDNQTFILLSDQQQESPLILFRTNESEYLPNFVASDNSESDVCEKWDISFSFEQTSPDSNTVFTMVENGTCSAQLQINNRYSADSSLGITYYLNLTASVNEGDPQEGEASYTASRTIVINFLDNNQRPVFNQSTWEFSFFEEDATQTQELEIKATYEVEDSEDLPIFYYLVTTNETIAALFNVNQTTGLITLNGKLDYETDEEFVFEIVASNDSSVSDNSQSSLTVTCHVIDINDNVPQWVRSNFFGAIMSEYIRNTPILTIEATDADKIDEGKLKYYINSSITINGTGLTNIPEEPFSLSETSGEIRLNFQMDRTMTGYFRFDVTVWDVVDPYGNGPHWNTTSVTIVVITSDNIVDFRFYNTIEEVQNRELDMLRVISSILNYDAYRQNIDKETQDGVELDDQTFASLYFIDSDIIYEAVQADTILRLVSNINTFSQLVGTLRNETELILMSFPSTSTSSENLEEVLRAWLVGVSVVLGALCVILLVTFVLKTRELNNRITNLTTRKFGSQESGLNRLGISAPTTNKHAIEGSNPMFRLNSDEIKRDLRDFDETSVRSGDSDLIGVEDNHQFDYAPNAPKKLTETMIEEHEVFSAKSCSRSI